MSAGVIPDTPEDLGPEPEERPDLILVVDDDQDIASFVEFNLKMQGYDVIRAKDGEEALEMMDTQRPDLAVIDWMMPRVDGLELCRRIRSTPALQDMHVVMITVKQDRESSLLAFECGADDFILKPFDFEELRARLCVAGRTVERQARLAARINELEASLASRDVATCDAGCARA